MFLFLLAPSAQANTNFGIPHRVENVEEESVSERWNVMLYSLTELLSFCKIDS
jgi:hypothetical protein